MRASACEGELKIYKIRMNLLIYSQCISCIFMYLLVYCESIVPVSLTAELALEVVGPLVESALFAYSGLDFL